MHHQISSNKTKSTAKKFSRRRRVVPVAFNRRAHGSRAIDPIERAAAETVINCIFDSLELRQMMAAHIVGSNVSYATIQSAVDAAQSGATVTVDAGNYAEMVTIGKPLTLLGARAGVDARTRTGSESVLTGSTGASGVSTIFYVTANDVTLDGFTVQGNTSATNMGAGIVMAPNIHGTHVVNNIIQNNYSGLFLSNNSNTDACVIQGNKFNNNAGGGSYDGVGNKEIYSDGSYAGPVLTNVFIDNNSFYAPNDQLQGAIDLHSASATPQSNITISNNTFDHTGKLLLINCNNVTLLHNTITNQTDTGSAAVRFEGHNNVIDAQYNSIYSNGGVAMAVDDKGYGGPNSGLTLNNNNIYQDGAGLYIDGDNYVGTANVTNNWWGNASGPSHDGPGTGLAIGNAAFNQNPSIWTWQWKAGAGPEVFSPWATSLLNLTSVPAPASPSSIVATAASSRSIQLSWSAPSSTATSQLLQRSTDGVNFATVATLPPLLNSFVDTGVTSGTAYTYRVIASNSTGNSAASNTSRATPPAYQPPVSPPALNISGTTSTTATLAWTAPSYAVGLAGYVVYRNGTAIGTVAAGTTTFTDTGLAASTNYSYTVATLDDTGATSAPTAAVSARTAALPQIVFNDGSFETTRTSTYVYRPSTTNWTFVGNSGLQANGSAWNAVNAPDGTQTAFLQGNGNIATSASQTFAINQAGSFTFTFSLARRGSNVQPILVQVDGTTVGTYTPGSTSFQSFTTGNVALAVGNHTLSFSTTSNNSGDLTTFLDVVSLKAVATAVPNAPTGLGAVALGKTQINLSWNSPSDSPPGFILQRSTDGTTFSNVATLAAAVTSYADAGLGTGVTYTYRLVATNSIGSSAPSSSVTAATLPASAKSTALSSLTWTSATSGWSVPKANTSVAGNTITIRGTTYASGIGTHADSSIVYNLAGGYQVFGGTVGIDDEIAATATPGVDFQVWGDGKLLFDSGGIGRASAAVSFAVSVAGVKTLTLMATSTTPGNIDYCHSDWAGATLVANPVAPAAPTNVVATPNATTPGGVASITVTWQGDGTQTGSVVQRSDDGGKTYTNVATVSGTTATYTDTTVAAGKTYLYRVIATNATGSSPASAADDATTQIYQAPVAPSGLKLAAATTSSVSLSWTAVANASGYVVYRNGNSVGTVTSGTAFTDTGLAGGTSYQYTVATLDALNSASPQSTAITVTTSSLPAATVADGSFETTRVTGYAYRPSVANWTFTNNAGLQANGSAWGAASAPDGTQTAFLQYTAGQGGGVSQNFVVGKTGLFTFTFSLARRTGNAAQPILVSVDGQAIGTYTPASTSFQSFTSSAVTLTAGTHMLAFATTATSGDNSSFLDTVSVVTQAVLPAAPLGLTATATSATQVRLTWAAPTDTTVTSYVLQRSTDGTTFTDAATFNPAALAYTDNALTSGTIYSYRLVAINAAGRSAAGATVSAAPIAMTATSLSSLNWTSATSGWKTVQKDANVKGTAITLRGTTYARGLGANTDSVITYNLTGLGYTTFTSDVGVDDAASGRGTVDFQVVADGKVVFDSGTLTGTSAVVSIRVDVTGVKSLQLVASNTGDGIDYDQADWAGATLLAPANAAPAAPTGLTAAATVDSKVRLAWTNVSPTATRRVQRSTDGVNFTTVADSLPAGTTSYSDATVQPGVNYSYRVIALNGTVTSPVSNTATVTTVSASAVTTNLSSLTWVSATSGWNTVQKDTSVAGKPLTLRGKTYTTGIGTHADSQIVYDLSAGNYTRFQADVGIDDGVAAGAQVIFRVYGDGVLLFDSGTVTQSNAAIAVDLAIAGVKTLTLVAVSAVPGNIDYAHADWAGARVVA